MPLEKELHIEICTQEEFRQKDQTGWPNELSVHLLFWKIIGFERMVANPLETVQRLKHLYLLLSCQVIGNIRIGTGLVGLVAG